MEGQGVKRRKGRASGRCRCRGSWGFWVLQVILFSLTVGCSRSSGDGLIDAGPDDKMDASDGTTGVDGCLPNCEAKDCGDDGCGGSCGECIEDSTCRDGRCQPGHCTDDCGSVGLRTCLDGSSYHVCGVSEQDGCPRWGAGHDCPAGSHCRGGICAADDAMTIVLHVDEPTDKVIRPVWSRFNIWDVTQAPDTQPYPFYEEGILMTATGGRSSSEMYGEDANGRSVYDFSPLLDAIDNLQHAGIKPFLVIGNTPVALSDRPTDQGAFDANTGSPTDYARYREYISALAQALLVTYGSLAVRSWGYRLMTEPDNADWWQAGMDEYERLYDYSLAGLRLGGIDVPLDVGNYMTPLGAGSWAGDMASWIATQPTSQRLFSDDFSGGTLDGWQVLSGTGRVSAGALDLSHGKVVTNQSWQNLYITAVMRTAEPGPNGWNVGWLLFRFQDENNFYAVALHTDGRVELGRKVAGHWEGNLETVQTPMVPAQAHNFEVEAEGETVRVSLDGSLLIEYGEPGGPATGAIGVWAWQADHVSMDDVTLETLASHHPGALPRRVQRASFSCYARGQMGMDPRELGSIVDAFRQVVSPSLGDVLISVDEGQILFDEDGRYLWLGDGTELGAAWNAAIFKVALDVDLERYVQWGFAIDDLKSPAYNVVEMYEMLRGEAMVASEWSGSPVVTGSYVDGLGVQPVSGGAAALVFHYNEDRSASGQQPLVIRFSGLEPTTGYTLRHYRVDRDHSNFFSQWLSDSLAAGIMVHDAGGNSGSRYDLAVPLLLSDEDGGLQFWQDHRASYAAIDDLELLEPESRVVSQQDGDLFVPLVLPVNSVSLILLAR